MSTKRPTGAASGSAVAKHEAAKLPATHDYGADAGAGFEGQDASFMTIPFLALLQSNSPQVADNTPEGARAGMVFNTVTQELYDLSKNPVYFVPAKIVHEYTEWVPRSKGGGGGAGFKGTHAPDSDVVVSARERPKTGDQKARLLYTQDGNELVETFKVYGAQLDEDLESPIGFACLAFTSTKIKVFRAFNSRLKMFAHRKHNMPAPPPLWAHRLKLTSVKQKNAEGDFFNFAVGSAVDGDLFKSLLPPDSEAFASAKSIYELVSTGAAGADDSASAKVGQTGTADEVGEEPPF